MKLILVLIILWGGLWCFGENTDTGRNRVGVVHLNGEYTLSETTPHHLSRFKSCQSALRTPLNNYNRLETALLKEVCHRAKVTYKYHDNRYVYITIDTNGEEIFKVLKEGISIGSIYVVISMQKDREEIEKLITEERSIKQKLKRLREGIRWAI